jgi:glycosyltransferase involved in cell wall biosynthesis
MEYIINSNTMANKDLNNIKIAPICVFGHFAFGSESFDGQTIKTKTITDYLIETELFSKIYTVDTCGWKNRPFSVFLQMIQSFFRCSTIIFLLSQNGRKIFYPLFFICKQLIPIKIFQIVIGGALDRQVLKRKQWVYFLNSFNANFVETIAMKQRLNSLNVRNVIMLPNCKKITVLSIRELRTEFQKPFPICTYSRVMEEKGIEDAIEATVKINTNSKQVLFHLDIIGKVDQKYEKRFYEIINQSPDYIQYKGVIPSDHSVETLKNYFLLLFLTYWENEGFAGCIIDAFSAGLPVVASNWGGNSEIITEGKTGRIVPVHDQERLISILQEYAEDPGAVMIMKQNCVNEARKYSPEQALKPLLERLV